MLYGIVDHLGVEYTPKGDIGELEKLMSVPTRCGFGGIEEGTRKSVDELLNGKEEEASGMQSNIFS